jgi:NADH:ubiquinone oxidoreductase subunit F (NADH-binding)
VQQAYEYGLLGDNILGSGFSFHVETMVGAGGYIAGEGSALMFSLEGKRPMPRTKPPRSVEAGLWMKPTALNNVETLANVPDILLKGGRWYASMGTEGTKGTKVFTFAGHVARTGTFEVEVGATMRQMVYDICGGIPNGRDLKAVQCAGPSGGCLPPQFIDLPVDFESLDPAGTMMGSGGMIVLDDTVCIVDYALYFARFNAEESCGKCTPCRIGTEAQYEIWKRIAAGDGHPDDLDALEESSRAMMELSLCGLGQTAPLPTLSALRFFREEILQHIIKKECPKGVCQTLLGTYAR